MNKYDDGLIHQSEQDTFPWGTTLTWIAIGALMFLMVYFGIVTASASSMKEAADATYKLYDGTRGTCSMTYVGEDKNGEDFFLSAAHCFRGSGNYNVRFQTTDEDFNVLKEEIYYVNPVRTLKSKDVVLVKSKMKGDFGTPVDVATPEEFNPEIGDETITIGYPGADVLTLTRGNFTGVVPGILGIDTPLYRATPGVKGGSSGGGLYAKFGEEWKLVGTTLGMRRDSEFMNYFTNIESVDTVLSHYIR